jgi:hypothetical protein
LDPARGTIEKENIEAGKPPLVPEILPSQNKKKILRLGKVISFLKFFLAHMRTHQKKKKKNRLRLGYPRLKAGN